MYVHLAHKSQSRRYFKVRVRFFCFKYFSVKNKSITLCKISTRASVKGSIHEKMKGGIGLRRKISAFDKYYSNSILLRLWRKLLNTTHAEERNIFYFVFLNNISLALDF